jgi:hypothetical protein
LGLCFSFSNNTGEKADLAHMNSPSVQLTIGYGQHNATYLFGLWPHCAYRVPFLGIWDQTNKEQKAIIFCLEFLANICSTTRSIRRAIVAPDDPSLP